MTPEILLRGKVRRIALESVGGTHMNTVATHAYTEREHIRIYIHKEP